VFLRILLFSVLFYLIIKLIRDFMSGPSDKSKVKADSSKRSVSKDVGEYVDYEEIKKNKKKDFR